MEYVRNPQTVLNEMEYTNERKTHRIVKLNFDAMLTNWNVKCHIQDIYDC